MARKIVSANADRQKFSVWLNYWLEVYAKPNLVKSTLKAYSSIVNKHIIPELGEVRMCDLSTKAFQSFFNKKATDNSLSPKHMKNIYDVMHIVLLTAIEVGIIQESRLENIEMPKCKEREKRFLSIHEQEILTTCINECDILPAFGMLLMLNTGIKKYELLSLKWADINDVNQSINLNDREIPMTESCYKALVEHKEKQKKAMERKSLFQTEDTYVITNCKFPCYTPEGYNKLIKRIASECDLSFVTAATLRNTFGANCLNAGVDIASVSYLMGDSNVRVTKKRYASILEQLEM